MLKILGLDAGTDSMGWAIVEQKPTGEYLLREKGVSIFQEGVKVEKGIESSRASERTEHRSARRRLFRRKLRKIETLKVLSDYDLCPHLTDKQLNDWKLRDCYPLFDEFILWQRTDEKTDRNPYHDRYECLTRKLDLENPLERYLLGRALYHIAQRRGFLSNRLETTKESNGAVTEEISALNAEMQAAGCNYLGEFFYTCYKKGIKIRNQYTSRKEHYLAEFNAICERQELPAEWKTRLEKAIFFQRPLRSQKGLVGHCQFERNKSRCPTSHPRFEEFRMWCFINNIKIQTPADPELRALNDKEVEAIVPLFLRKSKKQFNFEEIAKKLAGKGNYTYNKDRNSKPYRFNFRMTTSVSGCFVTAQLVELFGEKWQPEIARRYTARNNKSVREVVNDIWHVLFSFDDADRLRDFGANKLALSGDEAVKFAKITLPQDYAALSLNAIDKMLPYLQAGLLYSHAVFLANIPAVVPKEVWADAANKRAITEGILSIVNEYTSDDARLGQTIAVRINDFLSDNFELEPGALERLYHPSMIDNYPEPKPNSDGLLLLDSPRIPAIRNPMAMRALFRLRHLINTLLRDGKIDRDTKIRIEFARELNDANKRRAIETVQREKEKDRNSDYDTIKELYRAATGREIEPSDNDLLKYQLWKEQNRRCPYTGNEISISQFIGAAPEYDIEHTIPRSVGGDNSQMNKTLCESRFNRDVKGTKIPSELANHAEILVYIESWHDKVEELSKLIEKTKGSFSTKEIKDAMIQKRHRLTMERNYWRGKYERFTMTEVPEGFSNSQGVDIGIISKYARMYLKTVFPRIYTVKGAATAEFRKMWGLQETDTKKERANHIHHCTDAITIACMGPREYAEIARYFHDRELYDWYHKGAKPLFPKPWSTFTEDVKAIEQELLIAHYTPDNLPKQTRKRLRIRGKEQLNKDGQPIYIQGDTVRGSLHQDTYYGAVMLDGQLRYVVRKSLSGLQESDVKNIVDKAVREKVEQAIAEKGFKQAMAGTIWMNEQKGVPIRKVRCIATMVTSPIHLDKKHRDASPHEYKQQLHVVNDGNYLMAVYEGIDAKGKVRRSFELLNNMEAARFYKRSADRQMQPDVVPLTDKNGYPLKCTLKTGTMVLFYEKSPEELFDCGPGELRKRLYKVIKMSKDGRITFKFHQEARNDEGIKSDYEKQYGQKAPGALTNGYSSINFTNPTPKLLVSPGSFDMLTEGFDFELTITGEVKFKK